MVSVCWFRLGVFPQKTPKQILGFHRSFILHLASVRFCRSYWGVDDRHPYLLIALRGKRFHRAPDNIGTDPNSSRPVKAKLRRRKWHALPLRILLLPANPKLCKGKKGSRRREFFHGLRPPGKHA